MVIRISCWGFWEFVILNTLEKERGQWERRGMCDMCLSFKTERGNEEEGERLKLKKKGKEEESGYY